MDREWEGLDFTKHCNTLPSGHLVFRLRGTRPFACLRSASSCMSSNPSAQASSFIMTPWCLPISVHTYHLSFLTKSSEFCLILIFSSRGTWCNCFPDTVSRDNHPPYLCTKYSSVGRCISAVLALMLSCSGAPFWLSTFPCLPQLARFLACFASFWPIAPGLFVRHSMPSHVLTG